MSNQYKIRDFHILSDACGGFKPIDAVCQFEYKNHQVSISTAGLSQGACQTEVAVFKGSKRNISIGNFNTVQEAIKFIDDITYLQSLPSDILKDLTSKVTFLEKDR